MDLLIKIAQFLLSLTILVLVHELGHFTFARLFKTRVERFRIFFSVKKPLWTRKIGETDFGIGWIPLGGYVKIAGMVDESMDRQQMRQPAQPWEFRSKPTWQRLLMMIGGVLYNLIFAWLIYTVSLNVWGETYLSNDSIKDGLVVSEAGYDVGFRTGDKVLSVYGEPVERYSEINTRIIMDAPGEVVVLRGGKEEKIYVREDEVGKVINSRSAFFEVPRVPFVIGQIGENGPASLAGLQAGDNIQSVNGQSLPYFDQYKEKLSAFAGDSIELGILREGELQKVRVKLDSLGRLGVYALSPFSLIEFSEAEYSFVQTIPLGLSKAKNTAVDYVKQLKMMFSPEVKAASSIGGFITIGSIFPSRWNWEAFWSLTAFLSILLGVMNILPIPALDGGHVILLLYEMITGQKPSLRFLEIIQMVGIVFLFGLMILANANDLIRLIFG